MLSRKIASLLGLFVLAGCVDDPGEAATGSQGPAEGRAAELDPEQALATLQKSLEASFDAHMAELDDKDRARVANAMGWADEHPKELRVTRSRRGTVTHVSARFLAHDDAPNLEAGPTSDRAKALFESTGIGAALMGLGPDDAVTLTHEVPLAEGAVKFVFEHQHDDYLVYAGQVAVILDKKGRLTRFDAGPAAHVHPVNQLAISDNEAVAKAIADLEARKDPMWKGATIEVTKLTKMIANMGPWKDVDKDRFVWRVDLSAGDGQDGTREVIVDGSTGEVLASIEHTKLALASQDRIQQASGIIGEPGVTLVGSPWTGDRWDDPVDGCPGLADPREGTNPLERDWDETKAALCAATTMIEDASGIGWRQWFDPAFTGLDITIGLTPLLSVGSNNGRGTIKLAEGVGRAEIVGHELFHTALGVSPVTSFGPSAQRDGIIEHMCDAFGLLVERSFEHRVEDVCSMNDDPDSMNTVATIDLDPADTSRPYRWCADRMVPDVWRDACDPTQINGGWCEGADRYTDLGANVYDTYGETSGPNAFVPSHTNLGIGNRIFMSLLGEASDLPDRFTPISDATALDLLLRVARALSGPVDWTAYGDAMLTAAREIDGSASPGMIEHQLRSYLSSARMWNRPAAIRPAGASLNPSQQDRVAAASTFVRVPGSPGVERTYLFYRPDHAGSTVEYVWRDDAAGEAHASATNNWQGPCELPGVATHHAVAATGRDDGGLWVAWNDAAAEGWVGTLRVTNLVPGAEATTDDTCGDMWTEAPALQSREMIGAPAIADWVSTSNRTLCEIFEADFPGLELPFRAAGAMGLQIGNCVDIFERIPPWVLEIIPKEFGPFVIDKLIPWLDETPMAGIPAPFDPRNPDLGVGRVEHRIPLLTMLGDSQLEGELGKFKVIGPRFAEAFETHGLPDARTAELVFGWELGPKGDSETGLPDGMIETIEFRFADASLIVAFRDPEGALRVVPFTDPRPTEEIPLLATDLVADPALATASRRLRDPDTGLFAELEFLYVVYGTEEDDGAGPVGNRLNYRFTGFLEDPDDPAAFKEEIFAPAERLDMIRDVSGFRRQVDYRMLRTYRTPVVTGKEGALEVFVVGLREPSHEPTDGFESETSRSVDRIRHVSLTVEVDGKLSWDSERPVLLTNTRVSDGAPGEAGGAMHNHRGKLRWFYPNGTQLEIRSRH